MICLINKIKSFKNKIIQMVSLFISFTLFTLNVQAVESKWYQGAVGYNIYIDTFRNGNYDNDPIFNFLGTNAYSKPTGTLRSGTEKESLITARWGNDNKAEFTTNEWNSNYNSLTDWEIDINGNLTKFARYYGGDFQGIKEKLSYLKELGVDYIILSSPFYSLSTNKYDAVYFHHVDPIFGVLEQTGTDKGLEIKEKTYNVNGAKELDLLVYNTNDHRNILGEDLLNVNSWVWTDSDLEFASLLVHAHDLGIKVVLEVAINNVSDKFFAKTLNEDMYIDYKNNVLNMRNEVIYNYLYNSMKKWVLGPNGRIDVNNYNDGIDGIKFVYYADKNLSEIDKLIGELKKINDNLFFVGDFKNNIDIKKQLNVFDSVVDYNLINNLMEYTINDNVNYEINSFEFATRLKNMYENIGQNKFSSLEIYVDSVDTDRVYSSVINKNRNFDTDNKSEEGYLNIRPDLYDDKAINKLKRIIGVQMMLPVNAVIYYGDEKGMWGADSPYNKKPMLWEDYMPYENETDNLYKYTSDINKFSSSVIIDEVRNEISYPVVENKDILDYYKKLLKIRNEYKNLFANGELKILEVYDDPKTKERIDKEIKDYIHDEERKIEIYQKRQESLELPNIDFITYEVKLGKESLFVIINNSIDSYPLKLKVNKTFGFYKNLLIDDEDYIISDRSIDVIVRPYELKVLYSNDSNIFDSLK